MKVSLRGTGLPVCTQRRMAQVDAAAKARAEAIRTGWPFGVDLKGLLFFVYMHEHMPSLEEALTLAWYLQAVLGKERVRSPHAMHAREKRHLPYLHGFPCVLVEHEDGTIAQYTFRCAKPGNPGNPLVPEVVLEKGGALDPTTVQADLQAERDKAMAKVQAAEADIAGKERALTDLEAIPGLPDSVKARLRMIIQEHGSERAKVLRMRAKGRGLH